jgi:DNA-binding transcriptional LysR family regulator
LADAKRVLALSTEIVKSVQRLSRQETPPLNLGYVADLFYDLLPATLESFRRAFPTTAVNLFDMNCGDQFRAILCQQGTDLANLKIAVSAISAPLFKI